MRASSLYNQLLEPSNVAELADQYRFRGHLGDQDFFTMIGMEHPELFYSLACGWNRQLCTWWRDHGYGDVFQLYYHCGGPVYIYHGNCNSPIPDDWLYDFYTIWFKGNIWPLSSSGQRLERILLLTNVQSTGLCPLLVKGLLKDLPIQSCYKWGAHLCHFR